MSFVAAARAGTCSCGKPIGPGGECAECARKRMASWPGAGSRDRVPTHVAAVLSSGGTELDPETRGKMAARLGHDFASVRIHADPGAARSAQRERASAYTVGERVVFGAGQFSPHTGAGQRLLAHELTHVVQQRTRAPTVQRQATPPDSGPLEREAADAGAAFAAGDAGRPAAPAAQIPQCDRRILAEGTCAHLACHSVWACCDPNGVECPGKTTSNSSPSCPSRRWSPLFTCDRNCATALSRGCSDSDNWMAIPARQFSMGSCGDVFTVCANGRSTTGHVRDRSETATSYEVSPGIQTALGVRPGTTFMGAIYRPGRADAAARDPCCGAATPADAGR